MRKILLSMLLAVSLAGVVKAQQATGAKAEEAKEERHHQNRRREGWRPSKGRSRSGGLA